MAIREKLPVGLRNALNNPAVMAVVGLALGMALVGAMTVSTFGSGRETLADVYTCSYNRENPSLVALAGVYCFRGNVSIDDLCPFADTIEYNGRAYIFNKSLEEAMKYNRPFNGTILKRNFSSS